MARMALACYSLIDGGVRLSEGGPHAASFYGALDAGRRGVYAERMEGFLFPLTTAALLLPIAWMALPPALSAWRRRREVRRGFRPSPPRSLVMPAPGETDAAIERFHEALRRSDLSDFLRSP